MTEADEGAVTLQEAWGRVALLESDAKVLAAYHRGEAAARQSRGDSAAAARSAALAAHHERAAAIYARVCGLIDLVMNDAETLARLRARAAERKALETGAAVEDEASETDS